MKEQLNLRIRMPPHRFLLIALLSLSPILHAQSKDATHYQLYGGYTWLSNSFNGVPGSQQPLNGWDAAAVMKAGFHGLQFKMDVFRYFGTNQGAKQDAFFIMGGGQYSHRLGRETVFAEGLFGTGGINKNWGPNQTTGDTASFSSLAGGGLDTPITRHLAYRAQADFQYAYFNLDNNLGVPYHVPGLPTFFGHVTTGLVWKF
jgi:hypothetical protein